MQKQTKQISFLGLITWTLAATFFLYEFFLRTLIGSIAHQLIPALKLNAETFALLGSAYYFAFGTMQIPAGALTDMFGIKRTLIFSTLICAAATYLLANATSFSTAFISRFIMGFGSSFAFICLLIITLNWFPRKYFGFFAGVSQFVGTIGPFLAGGPLIAAMQAYHETWRTMLSTISGAGIVLCILIALIVKDKRSNTNQTTTHPPAPAKPLSSSLLTLFKNKQAWAIALFSGATYTSIALMGAVWGTAYLQSRGLPQVTAAGMISTAWLGYAFGCPFFGALSDLTKRRKPTLIICSFIGLLSTAGILLIPTTNDKLLFHTLFFGLGIGASAQNVGFATMSEHVCKKTLASAFGMNNAMITVFDTIIPIIVSFFIYLSAGNNITHLKPHDFLYGLSIMPLLYLLSILIALFGIKETFCKPQNN